jgi:hypothetical protein
MKLRNYSEIGTIRIDITYVHGVSRIMNSNERFPIDLDLWRKVKVAVKGEKWKWDWDTWSPVILRLIDGTDLIIESIKSGKVEVNKPVCPVCGAKQVYAFFLAVNIDKVSTLERRKPVYVADRYFGCHNCHTQVRDRGLVPYWFNEEELVWAIPRMKERALKALNDLL